MRYDFASDNTTSACPEAWQALTDAQNGSVYAPGYGEDSWTREACDLLRATFEKPDCEVFFVFNGTAANSLALAAMCHAHHAVVCHPYAHVIQDECHAPVFFSGGIQLVPVDDGNPLSGKLTVPRVEELIKNRRELHSNKPRCLSLTQSTELGSVYTIEEVATLSEWAKNSSNNRKMTVHMDGARFANAVASLRCSPADISWRAGVDILCFGGSKNGMLMNEAVLIFDPKLAQEFDYRLKQAGQLASKMRYLAAPWLGMLKDDVWLKNAQHANHCAQVLAEGLQKLPSMKVVNPAPQANAVFVEMSEAVFDALHERGWHFYKFFEPNGYRLMCSWATRLEAVQEFLDDCKQLS